MLIYMAIYDPEQYCRRPIRLKNYDYSKPGYYYVTICTQNRECLFGNIMDGEMVFSAAGNMIQKWWLELENKYTNIGLDIFQIMPNHIHGIIIINNVGANLCVRPYDKNKEEILNGQTHRSAPTIGRMIQWIKTMTTNEYIRSVKQNRWEPFKNRLWQRNYYEHIIRNDKELDEIRKYITENPAKWAEDKDNPVNIKNKDVV